MPAEAPETIQPTVEAAPRRAPLGTRSKAQAAETKQRIVGNNTRVPILDVAAFNSFIG